MPARRFVKIAALAVTLSSITPACALAASETPIFIKSTTSQILREKPRNYDAALLAKIIAEGSEFMRNKEPAKAYALLEPEEGEYSGDIGYDYLLGTAALDSGNPDRATIALERVLMVNPQFVGARFDLGAAYYAMGSDDLAKNEFEAVLAKSPPPSTEQSAKNFLKSIEERNRAKIQRLSFYIENALGHDDNITAATPDFTSGVCRAYGACTFNASGGSLRYFGMYGWTAAGMEYTRRVNENYDVNIFTGMDIKKRVYYSVPLNNNANFDARMGFSANRNDNLYKVTATYGQYLANGFEANTDSNRNTAGLATELTHRADEQIHITWSLQYNQSRSLTSVTQATKGDQDSNQTQIGMSILYSGKGASAPIVFTSFSQSFDRAFKTRANGSDASHSKTNLMMHLQFTPFFNTDLFLSGLASFRVDDTANARSSAYATDGDHFADDQMFNISTGLVKRFAQKWTFKTTVAWTKNLSSLSLYQYKKTEGSISLRRDF